MKRTITHIIAIHIVFALCIPTLQVAGQFAKAKRLFNLEQYKEAIPLLEELIADSTDNANVYYYAGVAHLHGYDYAKGLEFLEKASQLNPKAGGKDRMYWQGIGYHYINRHAKAINLLENYEKSVGKRMAAFMNVKLWISAADRASRLPVANTVSGYQIRLLTNVNSAFMEHSPTVSDDGNTLYFTCRNERTTGGKRAPDGGFMEDIMMATRNPDGSWGAPTALPSQGINTKKHDASVHLYDNDSKFLIYHSRKGGDFYVCEKEGSGWGTPKPLPRPINSRAYEAHACVTKDGKTMIFSSNRARGDLDLYMSKANENGKWGKPKRLGKHINTLEDQDAPFISADGQTLYFASKGHNSVGGYDLFRSEWNASADDWGTPENLGAPFNSPQDDTFLIWDANEDAGFFASARSGGQGELDLYEIDRSFHMQVQGLVMRQSNSMPVSNIKIVFVDNKTKNLYDVVSDNDGAYSITLPSGHDFSISLLKTKTDQPALDLTSDTLSLKVARSKGEVHWKNFTIKVADAITEGSNNFITPMVFEGTVASLETQAPEQGVLKARMLDENKPVGDIPVGANGKFKKEMKVNANDFVVFDFHRSDGAIFPSAYTIKPSLQQMLPFAVYIDDAFNPKLGDSDIQTSLDKGKGVRIKSLVFDYKSAKLEDHSKKALDDVIKLSQRFDDVKIQITGHNFGFDVASMDLSQRRVLNIIRYLETKGVKSNQIFYGYQDQDETFRDRAPKSTSSLANMYIRRVDVKIVPIR